MPELRFQYLYFPVFSIIEKEKRCYKNVCSTLIVKPTEYSKVINIKLFGGKTRELLIALVK